MEPRTPTEAAKRAAALGALGFVEPGMRLGLGTGSTAEWLIPLLAARAAEAGGWKALDLFCVPTSSRTRAAAEAAGLRCGDLDEVDALDLAIDGADELDPALRLIKGGGGALFQEKIVAAAAARMIVIADGSKQVADLGAFPLPIEATRFGLGATRRHVAACLAAADVDGRAIALRMNGETPYVTDEGNLILDLDLGRIGDPPALAAALGAIPGVVETGLFIAIADTASIGRADGGFDIIGAASP